MASIRSGFSFLHSPFTAKGILAVFLKNILSFKFFPRLLLVGFGVLGFAASTLAGIETKEGFYDAPPGGMALGPKEFMTFDIIVKPPKIISFFEGGIEGEPRYQFQFEISFKPTANDQNVTGTIFTGLITIHDAELIQEADLKEGKTITSKICSEVERCIDSYYFGVRSTDQKLLLKGGGVSRMLFWKTKPLKEKPKRIHVLALFVQSETEEEEFTCMIVCPNSGVPVPEQFPWRFASFNKNGEKRPCFYNRFRGIFKLDEQNKRYNLEKILD